MHKILFLVKLVGIWFNKILQDYYSAREEKKARNGNVFNNLLIALVLAKILVLALILMKYEEGIKEDVRKRI